MFAFHGRKPCQPCRAAEPQAHRDSDAAEKMRAPEHCIRSKSGSSRQQIPKLAGDDCARNCRRSGAMPMRHTGDNPADSMTNEGSGALPRHWLPTSSG